MTSEAPRPTSGAPHAAFETSRRTPETPRVTPGTPRAKVQARLPDGRLFEGEPGVTLGEIACAAAREGDPLVLAAVVDGRLRALCEPLRNDASFVPVSLRDADGARIYRRSLVLLLVTAVHELLPEAQVFIEHAATSAAGYFCEVRGRAPLTQDDLRRVEARMREIVDQDAPITRCAMAADEAAALFRARAEEDKAQLCARRHGGRLTLYELRGRRDYFQGYLAPSAGYLRHFALAAFPPGFLLYFPHQSRPGELDPGGPYPKLFAVFEEASGWLEKLGIRSAGALNLAVGEGRLPEVSLVAEALHEARIAEIAAQIAAEPGRLRLVLVAGPSASGKTSFAKRLAVQLLALGRRPFPLSLDDYYHPRALTPPGADGRPDFESLTALDLELLDAQLLALLRGQRVKLPRYDFPSGLRQGGPEVTLGPDNILILEGIHGLNPALASRLPPAEVFRVYVSALTQLNLDRHNRVSTTDCRLIRRLVRDAERRGYSARDTLARWDSVTHAEKENIFAFQEHGDAIFNSALVHELAVLRPLAEPLLLQVRPDAPEFVEAVRLLSFLNWFEPAPADPVPDNSILREFIGGSSLERFSLWPVAPSPA